VADIETLFRNRQVCSLSTLNPNAHASQHPQVEASTSILNHAQVEGAEAEDAEAEDAEAEGC
jgi:hypothetical protein